MNYVAASLLLVMKTEEEAFWMLAVLLENILYHDSYSENLYGCHVEQRVFKDLFKKKLPRFYFLSPYDNLSTLNGIFVFGGWIFSFLWICEELWLFLLVRRCYECSKVWYIFLFVLAGGAFRLATHLDNIDFDVSLVITEWFLCLFAKSLPSEVCTPSSVLPRV